MKRILYIINNQTGRIIGSYTILFLISSLVIYGIITTINNYFDGSAILSMFVGALITVYQLFGQPAIDKILSSQSRIDILETAVNKLSIDVNDVIDDLRDECTGLSEQLTGVTAITQATQAKIDQMQENLQLDKRITEIEKRLEKY